MTQAMSASPGKEDQRNTPATLYNLAHFDEVQNRPTGHRQRVHDSVNYTVMDVSSRLAEAFAGSSGTCSSICSSIGHFPSKAKHYTIDTIRFYKDNPVILRKELLSGITVSLLQVPESVAFSYVAGLDPSYGLYATVFMGTLTALFGGRPGMISGAAGALAVVVTDLTDSEGPLKNLTQEERVQHVLMTTIFVGIFQMVFGVLGLAKFVTLIPTTAMIGFLNGLAIIIFMAQLSTFKQCTAAGEALKRKFEECNANDQLEWMTLGDGGTWMVLLIVFITMLIMHFFPKVPKIGSVIPASLVAVIFGAAFEHGINRPVIGYDIRTVGDTAPLASSFPAPKIPSLGPNADWPVVLTYAGSLAMIGIIESIMTLQAVNEIVKAPVTTHACYKETIAQGIGNLVSGLFRSMGGDAMIGQSTINVLNGARYRLSGAVAGIMMLVIVLAGSSAIEYLPVASLTGVLFMVVIHTFYWPSFKLLFRLYLVDVIGMLLVTILAVVTNLAIAVVVGVIWQSLVSVWENGKLLECVITYHVENPHVNGMVVADDPPVDITSNEIKLKVGSDEETASSTSTHMLAVYHISGPLLFGSARQFRSFFDIDNDPNHIIVDFKDSLVCDYAAVSSIRELAMRYKEIGKRMTIRNLNHRSTGQFKRDRDWVLTDAVELPAASTPLVAEDHENVNNLEQKMAQLEMLHMEQPVVHDGGEMVNAEDVLNGLVTRGDLEVEAQSDDGDIVGSKKLN